MGIFGGSLFSLQQITTFISETGIPLLSIAPLHVALHLLTTLLCLCSGLAHSPLCVGTFQFPIRGSLLNIEVSGKMFHFR